VLDYLKDLLLGLPGFAGVMAQGLTKGNYAERLEYMIAVFLFSLLVIFLFLPGTVLKLRRKITAVLLFAASPVILLYVVPAPVSPAGRIAAAWPYFALLACILAILYFFEEFFIWRPLLRKNKHHYPSWLKPPSH
jgi:hypothetical protein